MAQLGQNFNSSQHDDMSDTPEPVPAGDYLMKIVKSEIKETKAKTGKYISFEIDIIQGEYKGRKVWTNLNIINPNTVAVEIAQKELATICRACGKSAIQDTNEVHNIPFIGSVKFVNAKGSWPEKNEMTGYAPAAGAGVAQQTATQESVGSDDPGWD